MLPSYTILGERVSFRVQFTLDKCIIEVNRREDSSQIEIIVLVFLNFVPFLWFSRLLGK